jgi:protein Mpv17
MPEVSTRAVTSGRRLRRARLFASPRRRVHASALEDTLSSGSPLFAYESVLASSPLLTKCVTSGVGFAVADVVAQSLSGGFRDAKRTAANAAFGLVLYGPLSSAWYETLDAFIVPESPNGAAAVAAKTLLDQILWAPVLVTGLFAWDMACKGEPLFVARDEKRKSSQGCDPEGLGEKGLRETGGSQPTRAPTNARRGLKAKLDDDLLDTLKVNWTFWPAFHVLNFRFVAPPDRILYINAVQVLYNVFLVLKAAERGKKKDVDARGE